jgi:hypothetical protein
MRKLVWRVKLEADLGDGARTEVEVGRIEREDWADTETIGLSLGEGKRLSAAIQREIIRAQASMMGERFRSCRRCGSNLSSKGVQAGDISIRVRQRAAARAAISEFFLPRRSSQ